MRFCVFNERLEGSKRVSPELVEISADTFDPGRIQLVDAPISDLPVEDQVGLFQDAQMLRNGRSADRQAFSDLVDSRRAFSQTLKDR